MKRLIVLLFVLVFLAIPVVVLADAGGPPGDNPNPAPPDCSVVACSTATPYVGSMPPDCEFVFCDFGPTQTPTPWINAQPIPPDYYVTPGVGGGSVEAVVNMKAGRVGHIIN